MGIPKFFRYISERYPLTSQLVEENRIPEFDNLYLDMNGIIHNCSHPNDGDVHHRISEPDMFLAIFSYIEHLFSRIKPQKLFFMAVDGVAPRAKMNQQRSRRFRTARDAEEGVRKALAKGEKIEAGAFDSNCITPGTPFMARLSEQLKYFVNKKITEDANWRGVQVVLSGHEVPGEGEHKIQEYIRLAKAQPGYNPNTRHCLYGLDADLIMLGLLSHDPHFCLLREEVVFGKKKKTGYKSLASQNFYLLHLSLMREYLDNEFNNIAHALPFAYDLERVIDDFILLAIFVGNDFLPHLPGLHINEGALEMLFGIYKRVLPQASGYLNEHGQLNTQRLQLILDELREVEIEQFSKEYADINWYKGKQVSNVQQLERARKRSKLTVTKFQKSLYKQVKSFVTKGLPGSQTSLDLPGPLSDERDRLFLDELCTQLRLFVSFDAYDDATGAGPVVRVEHREQVGDEDASADEESDEALERIWRKYDKAKVVGDEIEDVEMVFADEKESDENKLQVKMEEWKDEYYRGKLGFKPHNMPQREKLVYRYIEGLQWVLFYYYQGVASWSWFYDYHYAPKISDLRGVDKMSFKYDFGTPFRPFEQLMGVLPAASREHVPLAYRDFMTDPASPIIHFYPTDFELDLNGKKQDWEAVVKIPFIEQDRLLGIMKTVEHRLDPEEKVRNAFGTSTRFYYDDALDAPYPSSLPGFFPDIVHSHCRMEVFYLPTLGEGRQFVKGLADGALLGASALAGFPSMQTLKHTAHLGLHGVHVFQQPSRNESMVIHVESAFEGKDTAEVARLLIGKRVFINWPFLQEALVVGVSDELFKHELKTPGGGGRSRVVQTPHPPMAVGPWRKKADAMEQTYSKRFGILIGTVDIVVHVLPLKGLKRTWSGALVKDYEDLNKEVVQPLQVVVTSVEAEDQRYVEQDAPAIKEEFPENTQLFFLGAGAYGMPAIVVDSTDTSLALKLVMMPNAHAELAQFAAAVAGRNAGRYYPAHELSRRLHMSGLTLARITSSLKVSHPDGSINLGLNLKFEAKGEKVLGYSRKLDRGWEFSEKAIKLIHEYQRTFPEIFAALDAHKDVKDAKDIWPAEVVVDKVSQVKAWLKQQGAQSFEAVSLFVDQLEKETIQAVERVADSFKVALDPSQIKTAIVKGVPRHAVLKPAHAGTRLLNQQFSLGDRAVVVQDTGNVPLSAKGTVVSLAVGTIDVVFDQPFMAGSTLGDRCSPYRGMTVTTTSCLNLSRPQFISSMSDTAPTAPPAAPRAVGPSPAVRPRWEPPVQNGQQPPARILQRPARGRGGSNGSEGPSHVAHGHTFTKAARGIRPPPPPAAPRDPRFPTAQTQNLHAHLVGHRTHAHPHQHAHAPTGPAAAAAAAGRGNAHRGRGEFRGGRGGRGGGRGAAQAGGAAVAQS